MWKFWNKKEIEEEDSVLGEQEKEAASENAEEPKEDAQVQDAPQREVAQMQEASQKEEAASALGETDHERQMPGIDKTHASEESEETATALDQEAEEADKAEGGEKKKSGSFWSWLGFGKKTEQEKQQEEKEDPSAKEGITEEDSSLTEAERSDREEEKAEDLRKAGAEAEGSQAGEAEAAESPEGETENLGNQKDEAEAAENETENAENPEDGTEAAENLKNETEAAENPENEAAAAENEAEKTEHSEEKRGKIETSKEAREAEEVAETETEAAGTEAEARETETEAEATGTDKPAEKKGFFARLREGLTKTRDNIVKGIDNLFGGFSSIDEDFYEELEEILIMGDIGVNATTSIIERLKYQVKEQHIKDPKDCKELLIRSIREQMEVGEAAYEFEHRQSIIMVIGVNGVGKTTTVGKLAWKLKDEGKKVLIAAADTFRAAAGDQLAEWARRAGVPMIGGKEGADPASVVFDAVSAAKARGVDTLLIDTAGRLHNKKNLMEELRKMNRIVDREFPDAHRENLIVLDGTTGQNALAQAREFGDVTNLTGIVLTKMDGTAKGGIAVAIQSELKIPVKYIGVGETTQDLQKFDPDDFVNALFDVDLSENQENEE